MPVQVNELELSSLKNEKEDGAEAVAEKVDEVEELDPSLPCRCKPDGRAALEKS